MTQVGKYIIQEKIGAGAMGEVYRALDPALNRHVAIKTIAESRDTAPDIRARFLREAQSAAQLTHPNIITVYDLGEDQGKVFISMELLEGVDLKDLIRLGKPLSLPQKLRVMDEICDGLAFAHAKGIVHRDLKPGNIHIQSTGRVKIMDFGLARLASSDMTRTGLILGTPDYMSPEQVRGERVDVRSDVFSLGAVFYELLTKRRPFQAESLHATMFKIVQGTREPLSGLAPDLPPPLVEVVEKALAKDPAERYQHAGELRDALRRVRLQVDKIPVEDPTETDLLETIVAEIPQKAPEPAPARAPALPVASGAPDRSPSRPTVRRPGKASTRGGRHLMVAAGVAGVAIVAGLVFFLRPGSSPDKLDTSAGGEAAPVGAVYDGALRELLDRARRSLEDKQYPLAADQAQEALALDPTNAEALGIRDEARAALHDLESALAQARTLLDGGEAQAAAQALSRALAIDASHPLASELSLKLKSHFRAQAEGARKQMETSRNAAVAAGAGSRPEFSQAEEAVKEGDLELSRQEFPVAFQKFTAAKDRFDRARRTAEQEQERRRAEASARADLEEAASEWKRLRDQVEGDGVREQASFHTAMALEADAARFAAQGELGAAARAYREAASHLQRATDQAAQDRRRRPTEPKPPTGSQLQTTLPGPELPPPSTSSVSARGVDEEIIREVIARWERAIETQDISLYRSVKPNLSRQDEERLRGSFAAVRSHQVEIAITSIDIEGSRARVQLSRQDTIVANGQRHSTNLDQTLVLSRQAEGWVILDIGR